MKTWANKQHPEIFRTTKIINNIPWTVQTCSNKIYKGHSLKGRGQSKKNIATLHILLLSSTRLSIKTKLPH